MLEPYAHSRSSVPEPFGHAVGLWSTGSGPVVVALAEERLVGVRAVGEPVVGQHPLDRDRGGSEDGERPLTAWGFNTPYGARRLSLVDNGSGDDN